MNIKRIIAPRLVATATTGLCLLLLGMGCAPKADTADKTPPSTAPNVAGNASLQAPSPEVMERERKNAELAAKNSQEGTEQFKQYLKQKGGK